MQPGKSVEASSFLYDAVRFILANRFVIEIAPLQIYCSAIVFAPEESIVRKKFISPIPKWITRSPQVQKDWGAALQTLEGHTDSVMAVTFSPDSKQVASASDDRDGTVRLWDAATGAALQTLEGLGNIGTLSFLVDGSHLQTDRGSFRLHSHANNALPQPTHSSEVFVRDEWIARRNVNLLWLPHEHRAFVTAVFGDVIVIGQSSRISMFEFSF